MARLEELPVDILLLICGYSTERIDEEGWAPCELTPIDVPPPDTTMAEHESIRVRCIGTNIYNGNLYRRRRAFGDLLRPLCYASRRTCAALRPLLMDSARGASVRKMQLVQHYQEEDRRKSIDVGNLWYFFDQAARHAMRQGFATVRYRYNNCKRFFIEHERGAQVPDHNGPLLQCFCHGLEYGAENWESDDSGDTD